MRKKSSKKAGRKFFLVALFSGVVGLLGYGLGRLFRTDSKKTTSSTKPQKSAPKKKKTSKNKRRGTRSSKKRETNTRKRK